MFSFFAFLHKRRFVQLAPLDGVYTGGIHVRIFVRSLVLGFFVSFPFSVLQANSFVNPAFKLQTGDLSVGTGFVHSRVDYERASNDFYIDRNILGADMAYGLSRFVDLYANLGFTVQSELERANTDGSGFVFGAGGRGIVHRYEEISVFATGGFTYQLEDYASRIEGSHFEVNLGAALGYELNPTFDFFGGVDVIPFSNGEIRSKDSDSQVDTDLDQLLSLRFGSNIHWQRFTFRPEISLFAKQSFALNASTIF